MASVIFHSGMITTDMLKPYDNKMTQADISPFVNACIQQILGVEDTKSFNKNKRDGLNQSMIIACGLVKFNALFSNSKGQSVHNGNLLFKTDTKGIDHNKGTGDSTPVNKKDSLAWSKEVLKFVNKSGTHYSPVHKKGIAFFDAVGVSENYTGLWSNFDKTNKLDFGSMTRTDLKRWFNQLQALIEQFDKQIETPRSKIQKDIKAVINQ